MSFPSITSVMRPIISGVDEIPDDLDLLYDDGCSFFRVPVAQSDDGRWLVAVDVGYRITTKESPCPGVRPLSFVMFGYEITLFDQVDSVVYQTMDPQETKEAIPNECRALVIDLACACYCKLLSYCDPDYIYRFTWLTKPSDNALKKHIQATETLTLEGYTVVRQGTKEDGCRFWLLGRNGMDHSDLDQPNQVVQLGVEP